MKVLGEVLPSTAKLIEHGETRLVFESGTIAHIQHPDSLDRLFENSSERIPRLFLVSGDSESGKSTFGTHGMELGLANRVKIYKIIANLQQEGHLPALMLPEEKRVHGFTYDPLGVASLIATDPELQRTAVALIVGSFKAFHKETGIGTDVVEALKHPWISDGLKRSNEVLAVSLYVKAPLESRVKRQALHLQKSVEEVEPGVKEKDTWKDSMGNAQIKDRADIIIDNTGTREDYLALISSLLTAVARHSPQFNGTPKELS